MTQSILLYDQQQPSYGRICERISMYRHQNISTDAVVVHCGTALKLFPTYNLRKYSKNQ